MRRPNYWFTRSLTAVTILFGFALAAPPVDAQHFGRNKVQYRSFDFRVLRTEHFDVYFYPEEEASARDAARMAEVKGEEQRFWRLVAERKGAMDARMQEFRWLLEELRVSFFAQELRTPQPVSVKRLDKAWTQLIH